ncbi:unnamed protein product [Phytomonas sp. EM1]|nr:unnamed protein product [Phytomonas sp. EM1]|eukprot:CCW61086.1 unnamed protein product [Phytomonas sp. isolate EM1]
MISTIGELFNLNHFDQFSSANDVIVIRQKDGSLQSSPFHVRFGRAKIWNSINKIVQIEVNGTLTSAVMKIGRGGVAYWLQPTYGAFAKKDAERKDPDVDRHHGGDHPPYHERNLTHPWVPSGNVSETNHTSKTEGEETAAPTIGHSAQDTGEEPLEDSIPLPLLHKQEDSTIRVFRNAIQNSGDARQAKLALQAVAAGEISRRRLSTLLNPKKNFPRPAFQSEDPGEAPPGDPAMNLLDLDADKPRMESDRTFIGPFQNPALFDLSDPSQPPTDSPGIDATRDPSDVFQIPHDLPDSDLSSTDLPNGNEDSYSLDPIESFELTEEQRQLGNCSFSSSLTSGVSVTEPPPMGELEGESSLPPPPPPLPPPSLPPASSSREAGAYFARSLLPSKGDLARLNLREGCNRVRYLARKTPNGEVVAVECTIFLWDCADKLVVSDIDGTITKSDFWGHLYQAFGKGRDWTHPGTCALFAKIAANGYRMVYLSARSVAQIEQTKRYLWSLEQEGVRLPLGPVLTAPLRFFTALTQELSKQSHVFKIACLESVRDAFPAHARPFFAGFGNRYSDVISYDAAGIPVHRIFIIDPSSRLRVCQVQQTYRNLAHLVDVTFPRMHARRQTKLKSYNTLSNAFLSGNTAPGAGNGGGGDPPTTNAATSSVPSGLSMGFFDSKENDLLSFNLVNQEDEPQVALFAQSAPCVGSSTSSEEERGEDAYGPSRVGSSTRCLSTRIDSPNGVAQGDASHANGVNPSSSHLNQKGDGSTLASVGSQTSRSPFGHPKILSPASLAVYDLDAPGEYVALDPDFSSYNHWRLDPSHLIGPSSTTKLVGRVDGGLKDVKYPSKPVDSTTQKESENRTIGIPTTASGNAGGTLLGHFPPPSSSGLNSAKGERDATAAERLPVVENPPQGRIREVHATTQADLVGIHFTKASGIVDEPFLHADRPSSGVEARNVVGIPTKSSTGKEDPIQTTDPPVASASESQASISRNPPNTTKRSSFFSFPFTRKTALATGKEASSSTREEGTRGTSGSQPSLASRVHQHPDALTYYMQLNQDGIRLPTSTPSPSFLSKNK